MKVKLFLFLFLGSFVVNVYAQKSLSDYSYVEVPRLYEFLYEEDQHQLNSLTKFLFNKYGFNAYFSDELPNVKRCDGLQAEVLGKPGFIYTRITVILKDCNGNEVFISEEGQSKQKEYKKAYHDAMRKAFVSLEELGVQQKEIKVYEDEVVEEKIEPMPKVINDPRRPPVGKNDDNPNITVGTGTKITANEPRHYPSAKFTSYELNGESFLLRKTNEGYSLYEESEDAPNGLLLRGNIAVDNNNMATYTSVDGVKHRVKFKENNDLVLTSTTTSITYKAQN
ncbi:hypothetical protein J1N09_09840 [Aureitalea sp. L0-47]|uniref:hypothetical protein n=1 Tax=Aureitalea sp. L0-47 TaxID=2816962 RepID=UPI002238B7AD|nr:hypothetical protein [Aureitalea sp. L0-47]MCW5520140.1 hypothetical protein [Aureitalea sp. L0-47]